MEAQPAQPAPESATTPVPTTAPSTMASATISPASAWPIASPPTHQEQPPRPHHQPPHSSPSHSQYDPAHRPRTSRSQQPLAQPQPQSRTESTAPSPVSRQPSRKSQKKKRRRRRIPSSSHEVTWNLVKLILQCLSVVLCVVCLGLSIGLATSFFSSFTAVNIVIVCIIILWNVADFVTLYFRGSAKGGIHPAAQLGVHLLFWVAIPFSIYITTIATRNVQTAISSCQWEHQSRGRWHSSGDYDHSSCPDEMAHQLANPFFHVGPVTAIVMFCFLWMVHFLLFFAACIDTARWHSRRRRAAMRKLSEHSFELHDMS